MSLKKGDWVTVLSGRDRGKKGKIVKIFPKSNRVIAERLNLLKVYLRPTQQNPKGGIVEVEGSLARSKVQLICPRCAKPTRVGHQFLTDGSKQRICKKCHEII